MSQDSKDSNKSEIDSKLNSEAKPETKPDISKNWLILVVITLTLLVIILFSALIYNSNQTQKQVQNTQNSAISNPSSNLVLQNPNSNPQSISAQNLDQISPNSNPQTQTSQVSNSSNSSTKPKSSFQIYREELEKIVQTENPKTALTKLNSDVYSSEIAQKSCHSLTHAIGHKSLQKYGSDIGESLKYNLDICGGGFVHGIIEEYLDQNPNLETFDQICTDKTDGICYHAIGHGLMLINNYDVEKAVSKCDKLETFAQKLNCGEGVFMENFDSENVSDANKPFLKSENPFYPCSLQKDPFADSCYYYSGRYIFKLEVNPKNALSKCLELSKFAATCARGMSAGILRVDLFNPQKMEKYCQSIAKYKNSCLEGSINYHLLMLNDSLQTQKEMCDKFQNPQNAKICTSLIAKSPFNNKTNSN